MVTFVHTVPLAATLSLFVQKSVLREQTAHTVSVGSWGAVSAHSGCFADQHTHQRILHALTSSQGQAVLTGPGVGPGRASVCAEM